MLLKAFHFKVEMSCEGCSTAVQKILTKNRVNGIADFYVDLADQSVKVFSTSLTSNEVLEILKKSGKTVNFVSEEEINE